MSSAEETFSSCGFMSFGMIRSSRCEDDPTTTIYTCNGFEGFLGIGKPVTCTTNTDSVANASSVTSSSSTAITLETTDPEANVTFEAVMNSQHNSSNAARVTGDASDMANNDSSISSTMDVSSPSCTLLCDDDTCADAENKVCCPLVEGGASTVVDASFLVDGLCPNMLFEDVVSESLVSPEADPQVATQKATVITCPDVDHPDGPVPQDFPWCDLLEESCDAYYYERCPNKCGYPETCPRRCTSTMDAEEGKYNCSVVL